MPLPCSKFWIASLLVKVQIPTIALGRSITFQFCITQLSPVYVPLLSEYIASQIILTYFHTDS